MIRVGTRLSIFPLEGALLLPRAFLPLHIFEPRYRALVGDALARDRLIAMIQPLPGERGEKPALFEVGCVGHIMNVEAMEDGRFNVVLAGVSRFRVKREIEVSTPFRQIEASYDDYDDVAEDDSVLPSAMRAEIELEARRFAEAKGYAVDWDEVGRLDDESLVNGIAQVVPFDGATKQALLEARDMLARAVLLVDFLRFGGVGEGGTLQ